MEQQDFIDYLVGKGLVDRTISQYAKLYEEFDKGLEEKELDNGYVNRFLNRHTSSVTRAFVRNLFDFADITHIKISKLTGRKPLKKRKSLTDAEIKLIRNWLYQHKNIRYLLLFDLSYYCALRKSEAMGILVEDFELEEWAEDPSRKCRLLIRGKGKRERIVPVEPNSMKIIIDYIADLNKIPEDRLFKFNGSRWQEIFREVITALGFSYHYTLHDLRRSRATYWLTNGIDISRVKNRLGHASISTTQLYINLDEEKELELWENE